MKTLRWIAIVIVVGASAGCQQQSVQEAKIDANKRWLATRAQMQYGLALEHLKSGQLDKARSKALEALALCEDYADARLLLAKILIEQGSYAAAATELEKVSKQLPNSAEAVYLTGVAREREGRLDDALTLYRKAYAMDNSHLSAVMAAAEVMVAQGEVREAQVHLDSYMSLAGDEPGMYELAGRIAMIRKEYDGAARHFQQAYDLDYKNALYLESLAKAQFFAGKYEEASESLTSLLEIKDRPTNAWARRMLADCYMAMDRTYAARDEYATVTRTDPSDVAGWVGLAKAALKLKDMDRAVMAAQQARTLEPGSLEAAMLLGWALVSSDEPKEAAAVLRQAQSTHGDSATLECLLGKALWAQGDTAEAVRCYTAALRLDPDNAAAKELLNSAGAFTGRIE